ncbi:MAG: CAP domain-containing protein [Patulibacter minatonensis]
MKRRAIALAGAATLAAPIAPSALEAGGKTTTKVSARAISSGSAVLSAVNYERQMANIDPLKEDADLTKNCGLHARYMASNNLLTHAEESGNAFFTPEGAWAGTHSVLARNTAGFNGNPWHDAPFHEFQALHPWLRTTGVGVSGNYACMVTLGERDAANPSDIKLVTVPGAGQFVQPAQIAREAPFVPGDEVGLPEGTKTGPHIYVYALGPERFDKVTVNAATLTAADDGSQVPLRWVDGSSARSGRFLDGGVILIPATPLRENTTYTVRVEAATTNGAGSKLLISRTSSFITGPDELGLTQQSDAGGLVAASAQRVPKPKTTTPVTVGEIGDSRLTISLKWNRTGVRARIHCEATNVRCDGPLRVLVKRKGNRLQKLRFVAGPGPLKVKLGPGRTITRRIEMDPRQRFSGGKRGFAVRWGGVTPIKLKAAK